MNNLKIYNDMQPLTNLSKGEIINLANEQAKEILDSGSPEMAYSFLSKIQFMIDETLDKIKEGAKNEILKGNNSSFGVKMSIASKSTYSFDHDQTWCSIKSELKAHEELMKDKLARYSKFNMVDEEGEVLTAEPAVRKISEYIKKEF